METNAEYCIVLHVIEGIRLNINNNDLSLIANLNGVKFEVIGQNTESATIFNSNCIWECTFDDFKRMKTDNRPIKIECFHKTIKNDAEVTKSVGFILLPIRSLQVAKTSKNLQIKLHWYKLCGLAPEWRHAKPELYLSAIITTKDIFNSEKLEDFMEPRPTDSSDSIYIKPTETSLMLKPQSGIYVNLLEEECRLQIGNGPQDIDTFFLNLTLKNAKYLEELVTGNENPIFRFHYDILGSPSDLILVANSDGLYNINEMIIVNFKSSLDSLKEYLRRVFYIPIDLYFNENIIGNYTFKLADLMPPSIETLKENNVWEVKDTFSFMTLFDILDSPVRPLVEYILTLTYVPAEIQSSRGYTEMIDKQARGDMGDQNECIELPPTDRIEKAPRSETQTRSLTHRVTLEKETNLKSNRSDTLISYKSQPQQFDYDNVAYDIIAELEDWKSKQMSDFMAELKQKEIQYLDKLSNEWERQRRELAKALHDKLNECTAMTESLEATQASIRVQYQKYLEDERALEKAKYELDKNYTVKFMEVEEKARRIKDEMDYQQKLHDLNYKQLLNEKTMKDKECSQMQEKIDRLEEEIKEMKKCYVPKEQIGGLLDDLREQSERFYEIEKSKNFYKQQWAKATREAHVLRLQTLKVQEKKLKREGGFGLDNIMDLRNLIFEECSELIADRDELENIKEVLTSDSDADSKRG